MARQLKQVTLATELASVEQQIAAVEAQLKPLEAKKEALRTSLLENLRTQGVQSVKLENGTSYVRAHKTTLKVLDERAALEWAQDNNSVKVDTTKAWKILKLTGRTDQLPTGLDRQDTEYLQVRKLGAKDDE